MSEDKFDITQHEWSDSDIEGVYIAITELIGIGVCCKGSDRVVDLVIRKQDAIAIAKHFGLTADDLK